MNDLVCIRTYPDSMEAELAKNFLDANAIPAMLIREQGSAIQLMVRSQDLDQAQALLTDEGLDASHLDQETRETLQQQELDNREAAEEFKEIKTEELRQKAQSIKSNAILGWVLLAAGGGILFLSHGSRFLMKAGMICIIFAIIQYFVWKDAVKAAAELEKMTGQNK